MDHIQLASDDALTDALAKRVHVLWDCYRSVDVSRLNAVLAEDYTSIHPDGTIHSHKAMAQEIASAAIDEYHLSHLQAFPIGEGGALVTYVAESEVGSHISPTRIKLSIGEVWIKQGEDWKCRYHQETASR